MRKSVYMGICLLCLLVFQGVAWMLFHAQGDRGLACKPSPTALITPALRFERTGDSVRLIGRVASRDLVLLFEDAARGSLPAFQLSNELELDPSVSTPAYLRGMHTMVGLLTQTAPEGTILLEGQRVVLSGQVPDAITKHELEAKARGRLPRGLELTVLLVVSAAGSRQLAQQAKAEIESTRLNFRFGSTRLTQEALYQVEPLVELAKSDSVNGLRIVGYTDSKGPALFNKRLSMKRSRAVAKMLGKLGVKGKLEVDGKGERNPASDNRTRAGRAKNRRVQFQVIEGG